MYSSTQHTDRNTEQSISFTNKHSHLHVQQETEMAGSSRATACLAGIKQAFSHNLHIETDMAACRATSCPAGIKQAITHNLQIEKDSVAESSRATACPAGIRIPREV